jgi:hypothetical protein
MVRLSVVYLVVGTLLIAAWQLVDSLSFLQGRLEDARAVQPEHRSIAPALYLDMSRDFVLRARDLLDEDATYAVVTGPNVGVSSELVLPAVGGFMPYALLPRRQVPREDAEWLLCYGCEPSILRGASVGWAADGLAIVRVRE